MLKREDVMHHTREEVVGYLQTALDIVDELGPPDDLRLATFAKAAELLAGKQIMLEQSRVAPGGASLLRDFGQLVGVVSLRSQWDERRNTSRVHAVPQAVIDALRRNRERYMRERPDWYVWIEARQAQRHEHALLRANGEPAACPVHGCMAVQMIAALYVDGAGVYANVPGVDVWDEQRDARQYAGPYPVVAHPPCARWCMLAKLVETWHGYRVGDDGGCFAAALAAVRAWGGVLEHPAHSIAWRTFGLPRPSRHGWTSSLLDPGITCEVDQVAYGHPARKRTWLYAVGIEPQAMRWERPAAARVVSSLGHGRKIPEAERVRPRLASATPEPFRDALLALARTAHPLLDAALSGQPCRAALSRR